MKKNQTFMALSLIFLFLLEMLFGCSASLVKVVLDKTFGTNGIVRNYITGGDNIWDQANSMVIQPDGKIVAVGYSEDADRHNAFALARYNQDGTLDKTFGTNGTVRNYISGGDDRDDEANSVSIQSDGKIIAAGWSSGAFTLARYNNNGTLDSTFGTSGTIRTYVAGGDSADDRAYSIAIQADGKIVVAGCSNDASGNYAFALARYNANGTLDNTFGTNGTVRNHIPGGSSDGAYSVVIQLSGKIVAAGYSEDPSGYSAFALACYDTNGMLDSTFGMKGTIRNHIVSGNDDETYSVAIQLDGKIVAVGRSEGPSLDYGYAFAIARYDTNGTLDNTFGTNGTVRNFISGGSNSRDEASSVAIQSNGKMIVVGKSADTLGNLAFALARYNTNGTLDNTFGTDGTIRTYVPVGKNQGASSVAIQHDGKIVVAGWSFGAFTIMRYDCDEH